MLRRIWHINDLPKEQAVLGEEEKIDLLIEETSTESSKFK